MDKTPETDAERIAFLLDVMNEHDLDCIKVTLGDAIYELVRRDSDGARATVARTESPAAAAASGPAVAPAHVKKVVAPLTGVYYSSASPDVEPFVKAGDRVEAGDVLCILEAMKLFNEIQSDFSGTIVRSVAENGELVTQGQDLFWIET